MKTTFSGPVSTEKCGWRISEWGAAIGVCRATVFKILAAGELRSAKVGSRRLILMPPSEFLAARADGRGAHDAR
jgi:hypothetical protein